MDGTEEQLLALAPTALVLRRAQEFATPGCWTTLGQRAGGAWGTQETEGLTIQTGLDLASLAYTCACQRWGLEAPCAHSLGLRLLLVRQQTAFADEVPPDWFTRWQAAQSLVDQQVVPAGPIPVSYSGPRGDLPFWSAKQALQHPDNPALLAHQKRRVEALAHWLRELLEQGLRHVPPGKRDYRPGKRDYSQRGLTPWQAQIYTLLDWELPGLAEALQALADQCPDGEMTPAAQDRLLAGLGKLYQLTQAFLTLAQLPAAEQQAVRLRTGLPVLDRARVRAQQLAVADTWHVLAQRIALKRGWGDDWHQRSTWLWGQTTGRYALILELKWNCTRFFSKLEAAERYCGELVFYPTPDYGQAVPAADWPVPEPAQLPAIQPPAISLAALAPGYAAARAQLAWLEDWPVTLGPVRPVVVPPGEVCLFDAATSQRLCLRGDSVAHWQLLAFSGGQPLTVFGAWDGYGLLPLAYWSATTATTTIYQ